MEGRVPCSCQGGEKWRGTPDKDRGPVPPLFPGEQTIDLIKL